MKNAPYYLLDVFTSELFGGNQLAIFPDATAIDESYLQKIAKELNIAETVFLYPGDKGKPLKMRIFTPAQEMRTAGHPTVGTALFVAREADHPTDGEITLELEQKIGVISVKVQFQDNLPLKATMFQPLPKFGKIHSETGDFAELLGLEPGDLENHPIQEVSCGNNALFVPVKSTASLAKIRFRLDVWDQLRDRVNGAFIYPFTTNGVVGGAVQGRMFAPDFGIMEDPATGSANGPLACYLSKHEILPFPLVSLQGFEIGRPSYLYLDIVKNTSGEITEVKVGGSCVFVGKGEFFLGFQ